MVKRYAVIDKKTGLCMNVILWDGVSDWQVPDGCSIEQSDTRQIDPAPQPEPTKSILDKVDQ